MQDTNTLSHLAEARYSRAGARQSTRKRHAKKDSRRSCCMYRHGYLYGVLATGKTTNTTTFQSCTNTFTFTSNPNLAISAKRREVGYGAGTSGSGKALLGRGELGVLEGASSSRVDEHSK